MTKKALVHSSRNQSRFHHTLISLWRKLKKKVMHEECSTEIQNSNGSHYI
jgi:hypothetical protein